MKVEGEIRFHNGRISYMDNFEKRLKALCENEANNGKLGIIRVEIVDKIIQYHRHKYYRGYLIPAIAIEAFDGNERKAHMEMKRQFMYYHVTSLDQIPEKHIERCIIEFDNVMDANGEIIRVPSGYMPSMANITDKEARAYLEKVEALAIQDLQVSWDEEEEKQALYHRNKALGRGGE